jgi:hypothetical protein
VAGTGFLGGRSVAFWTVIGSIATVLALLVTVLVAFTSIGGSSTTATPQPPALTQVRLVNPFNVAGYLLPPYHQTATASGGQCRQSAESSDPDARRCFTGDLVIDPCWPGGSGNTVACPTSPWDSPTLVITDPSFDGPPATTTGVTPWALEIRDPANSTQILQCAFSGGAGGVVAGMRINWHCSRPGQKDLVGYAIGDPRTSTDKPWTVFYEPSTSSEAVEAVVSVVWR